MSIYLSGDGLHQFTEKGEMIKDDTFLLMINSDENSVVFTILEQNWGKVWLKILDSGENFFEPDSKFLPLSALENIEVKGRSMVLLMLDKPVHNA